MKTNFDVCCESAETMAQIIDVMKCGWTKEQIINWLKQPFAEKEENMKDAVECMEQHTGFILENRMTDGVKPDGWYAGQNKKYGDMFDLTANKKFAKVFEDENEAKEMAKYLNKGGWNFVVLSS